MVHCWASKSDQFEFGTDEWADAFVYDATCLLEDGHDGPHVFTPDDDFVICFGDKSGLTPIMEAHS